MGTKREVTKACRSVPPQWYHSGDATSNRESERDGKRKRERGREKLGTDFKEKERKREREKERKREREKERKRERERERERESARRLQKEGRHTSGPKERSRKHVAAYYHGGITVVTRQATHTQRER